MSASAPATGVLGSAEGTAVSGPASLVPVTNDVLNCKLVGGFSIFIQVLVGTLGFSTLIIKRHFEHPRRPWLVWSFDVGKQMISGAIMHMCNLLVSALSSGGLGEEGATNPCSWYVLNLTLDCTLGVVFVAGYLRLFETIAKRNKITGLESGHYGDPPSWRIWMKQGLVFCASMLCMKFTVVMMVALLPFLLAVGDLILKPVQMTHSPRFEIVFVMAVWPLVLNIFESWVLDQFIKRKHPMEGLVSSTGHVPLSTYADEEVPPYTASIEMQNHLSVSSGSRTLASGSVHREGQRVSLDMSDFELGSGSDEDGYVSGRQTARRRLSRDDHTYHKDPFSLPPTPGFTPVDGRKSVDSDAGSSLDAVAKAHKD
ncbi:hypothetical protein GGF46_000487 [Coemansia sp. RSA 552]|nr:hypothetical protein GGF46_000487 [Coemansia sp. RSA 552]